MILWTDEATALAISLRHDGISSSKIAQRINELFSLGITRNSVIGRLYRKGESLSPAETALRQANRANQKRVKRAKSKRREPRKEPFNFRFGAPPVPEDRAVELTAGLPLLDLAVPDPDPHERVPILDTAYRQCRWVCDDGQCCGRPSIGLSSWCNSHYLRVYLPPKVRRSA
jgi:hypothetical protein